MKKAIRDITFDEFDAYCNARACDGAWDMFTALNFAEAVRMVLKVKPLFGRKKAREKEWERIKREHFKLDAELDL